MNWISAEYLISISNGVMNLLLNLLVQKAKKNDTRFSVPVIRWSLTIRIKRKFDWNTDVIDMDEMRINIIMPTLKKSKQKDLET